MTSFKDRVNAHLPILLQSLSTGSLILIALCALCGSQSLKKLADSHNIQSSDMHKGHMMHQSK